MGTKSTPDKAAHPALVDRLPGLESLFTRRDWQNYPQMGFGRGNVPELLRMACDPALNHADEDDPHA